MAKSEENRREDVKEREARDDGLFTIVECETLLQIGFMSFKNFKIQDWDRVKKQPNVFLVLK